MSAIGTRTYSTFTADYVRIQSGSGAGSGAVDEVRIARAWDDVVPRVEEVEPETDPVIFTQVLGKDMFVLEETGVNARKYAGEVAGASFSDDGTVLVRGSSLHDNFLRTFIYEWKEGERQAVFALQLGEDAPGVPNHELTSILRSYQFDNGDTFFDAELRSKVNLALDIKTYKLQGSGEPTLMDDSAFGVLNQGTGTLHPYYYRFFDVYNGRGDVVYHVADTTATPVAITTAYAMIGGVENPLADGESEFFNPSALSPKIGKEAVAIASTVNSISSVGRWAKNGEITLVAQSGQALTLSDGSTAMINSLGLTGIDQQDRITIFAGVAINGQAAVSAYLREMGDGRFEKILDSSMGFGGEVPRLFYNPSSNSQLTGFASDGTLVQAVAFLKPGIFVPPHLLPAPSQLNSAIIRETSSGLELVVDARQPPPDIPAVDLPSSYASVGWRIEQHYVDAAGRVAFFGLVGNPNGADGFRGFWAESSTGIIKMVAKLPHTMVPYVTEPLVNGVLTQVMNTMRVSDVLGFRAEHKKPNDEMLVTFKLSSMDYDPDGPTGPLTPRTFGGNATFLVTLPKGEVSGNQPSTIDPVEDQIWDEEVENTLALSASDPDDGQSLTFEKIEGPDNLTVSPDGTLSFTPTEEQGPMTFDVRVQVTDDGAPPLSDEIEFQITVNEVNRPPVLGEIAPIEAIWCLPAEVGSASLSGATIQAEPSCPVPFNIEATDPDFPVNNLIYSVNCGDTVTVDFDESSGAGTLHPTSPGDHSCTIGVMDDSGEADEAILAIKIISEGNRPPVFESTEEIEIKGFGGTGFVRLEVSDPDGDEMTLVDVSHTGLFDEDLGVSPFLLGGRYINVSYNDDMLGASMTLRISDGVHITEKTFHFIAEKNPDYDIEVTLVFLKKDFRLTEEFEFEVKFTNHTENLGRVGAWLLSGLPLFTITDTACEEIGGCTIFVRNYSGDSLSSESFSIDGNATLTVKVAAIIDWPDDLTSLLPLRTDGSQPGFSYTENSIEFLKLDLRSEEGFKAKWNTAIFNRDANQMNNEDEEFLVIRAPDLEVNHTPDLPGFVDFSVPATDSTVTKVNEALDLGVDDDILGDLVRIVVIPGFSSGDFDPNRFTEVVASEEDKIVTATLDTEGYGPAFFRWGGKDIVDKQIVHINRIDAQLDGPFHEGTTWYEARVFWDDEGHGTGQYLNLSINDQSAPVWVVKNLPISPDSEIPGHQVFTVAFLMPEGVEETTVQAAYSVTLEPLDASPGEFQEFDIGRSLVSIQSGVLGDYSLYCDPPYQNDEVNEVESILDDISTDSLPNQEQARNECVPAALSNLLFSLNGEHDLNLADEAMSIDAMKLASCWQESGSPGDPRKNYWTTTQNYFTENAYPIEVSTTTDIEEAMQALRDGKAAMLQVPGHVVAIKAINKVAELTDDQAPWHYIVQVKHDILQGRPGGLVNDFIRYDANYNYFLPNIWHKRIEDRLGAAQDIPIEYRLGGLEQFVLLCPTE